MFGVALLQQEIRLILGTSQIGEAALHWQIDEGSDENDA